MVDTHGYTESLFGLFELESKVFSPRIADLPDQRIYPMEKRKRGRPPKGDREPRYGELDALLRGPAIKRELIRDCWDDMHKVAASLKDGTTSATLLLPEGVNPKFVQELLGHADIKLTLGTYSHFLPSMGDQAANAMENALG